MCSRTTLTYLTLILVSIFGLISVAYASPVATSPATQTPTDVDIQTGDQELPPRALESRAFEFETRGLGSETRIYVQFPNPTRNGPNLKQLHPMAQNKAYTAVRELLNEAARKTRSKKFPFKKTNGLGVSGKIQPMFRNALKTIESEMDPFYWPKDMNITFQFSGNLKPCGETSCKGFAVGDGKGKILDASGKVIFEKKDPEPATVTALGPTYVLGRPAPVP
ncbi:hypothetical protein GYMLUDRAFT_87032 [Collybiopsis luxurians FD-317 M1]|uniref:Uncharacterized protein n=1 Tax=Collybiopsis luxurians FD-317 M1 TaxID=944289 RepID=A0A0D0B1M8_9AGAR|nr:hypothetical protein GYMLUDRAFT_87032 [Collybiopsis luxurians FD-317 M1]